MSNPTHLHDYLSRNARTFPDKPALICPDRTLTWKELQEEAERAEAWVSEHVAGSSQQLVGILLSNSWQLVAAYLGILKAGHIAVPLDPSLKSLEIGAVADQMHLAQTVTDAKHRASLPEGLPFILVSDLLVDRPKKHQSLSLAADQQIATVLFTSGTTGKPKAVPYTHANYLWNVEAVSGLWEWTQADVQLVNMPLSHWHGLAMGLGGALYHANTVYLPERFDAAGTLELLASGKISLFMHVPNAYVKLIGHRPDHRYDLSRVRLFVSGSSYLPPSVWQQFKDRFGQEILERYGSSETGLVASNTLSERIPGSVGYVLPGVEVKARPDGELMLDSPGLFPGYFRNPEATAAKRVGGLWLTGDIGEFDGRRLRLKGRVQEKIKKLSYTLHPRDLEWAMGKHPDVREVIVIGLQSPGSLNDQIVYFIVGDITAGEVTAYCKENLPAAWRPDIVRLLGEIPRTRSGKPAMAQLRAMASPLQVKTA